MRLGALALALVVCALPLVAEAQPAGKVARIGVLALSASPNIEAFRQRLHELGHVEGQSVVFEYRWEAGKPERLSALAAELVRLKVDVILAPGTAAAVAAKRVTSEMPVVFATVADPIGAGLVASLARPGGNMTGATTINAELDEKRLDLLRQLSPRASRIAILFSASDPSNVAGLERVKRHVLEAGLTAQIFGVREGRDVDGAFASMRSARTEGMIVFASPFLSALYGRIVEHAARNRISAIYATRTAVEAGGLMSYAANFRERHRYAATYVDKILKGARPADLPVDQPTTFEFVINLKTAKAIGLTIPPSLLLRADQIIE